MRLTNCIVRNHAAEPLGKVGINIEEEYIDLEPILENLFIRPSEFLRPIKRVEVRYVKDPGC